MATIDYSNYFEGIRESIKQAKALSTNGFSYDQIIRLKKPESTSTTHDYMFRILPYIKEGKEGLHKTFFYYATYFWKTPAGESCSVLSRKTFNEPCYISNYYYDIQRHGTDYEKEILDRNLKFKQGWYCNVYVVKDPVEPSNNGKVMVLSLNKTLWTKVQAALNGELDEEWSARMTDANPTGEEIHVNVGRMVTDLTDNGVNFLVKVASKGQFPDYNSSEFTRRDAKSLHLTEEQQKEILNSCVDVTKIERVRTAEEIRKIFDEKFRGIKTPEPVVVQEPVQIHRNLDEAVGGGNVSQTVRPSEDDDQIPGLETSGTMPNTEKDVDAFISQLSKNKGGNNVGSTFDFN